MKRILIPACFFLAYCSNNPKLISQSKEKELRTYFATLYKDVDSTTTIDSFMFVRFKNITARDKYLYMGLQYGNQFDMTNQLFELEASLVKTYRNQQRLYSDLSQNLVEDAKEKADAHMDSLNTLHQRSVELAGKMKYYDSLYKVSDSLKALGYEAVCFYQVRKKDQSVKKDTAFITLNQDKNIVDRKDFYK